MDLNALKDYGQWVGKNAEDVLLAVKAVGGWEHVFPKAMPVWGSRIRNYFNDVPQQLVLLSEAQSEGLLDGAQRLLGTGDRAKPYKATPPDARGMMDKVASAITSFMSLHGAVYMDEAKRIWFQMGAGGTIYHFGETPGKAALLESGFFAALGQKNIPIFKLIAPDGSGGSLECCIDNPQTVPGFVYTRVGPVPVLHGRETVGDAGVVVNVGSRHITDPKTQATYNYSETVVKGFAAHNLRDIKPHVPALDFYINPPSGVPMGARKFEANDPAGKPLAAQG